MKDRYDLLEHLNETEVNKELRLNLQGLSEAVSFLCNTFPSPDYPSGSIALQRALTLLRRTKGSGEVQVFNTDRIYLNNLTLIDAIRTKNVVLSFTWEQHVKKLEKMYSRSGWGFQFNLYEDQQEYYATIFLSNRFRTFHYEPHLTGAVIGIAYTVTEIDNLRKRFPQNSLDMRQILIRNYNSFMPNAISQQKDFERGVGRYLKAE